MKSIKVRRDGGIEEPRDCAEFKSGKFKHLLVHDLLATQKNPDENHAFVIIDDSGKARVIHGRFNKIVARHKRGQSRFSSEFIVTNELRMSQAEMFGHLADLRRNSAEL